VIHLFRKPVLDRTQKWILGSVVLLMLVVLGITAVAFSPKTTPTATPQPTTASTTVAPTPSVSVTPSASQPASPTPTQSASPSTSATTAYPAANDCVPGVPGAYQRLGQCAVADNTPLQVFEACQVAASGFMWNQSGGTSGVKVSDKIRKAAVKTCLAGFGLINVDTADVQGSPNKDAGLAYIMLKGGLRGGDIERFLFDAETGTVIDSTSKMQVFDDWVDQFHHDG